MSKLFKVCFQHFIYETNFTLLLQLETRRMQRDAKKIGFQEKYLVVPFEETVNFLLINEKREIIILSLIGERNCWFFLRITMNQVVIVIVSEKWIIDRA